MRRQFTQFYQYKQQQQQQKTYSHFTLQCLGKSLPSPPDLLRQARRTRNKTRVLKPTKSVKRTPDRACIKSITKLLETELALSVAEFNQRELNFCETRQYDKMFSVSCRFPFLFVCFFIYFLFVFVETVLNDSIVQFQTSDILYVSFPRIFYYTENLSHKDRVLIRRFRRKKSLYKQFR